MGDDNKIRAQHTDSRRRTGCFMKWKNNVTIKDLLHWNGLSELQIGRTVIMISNEIMTNKC
eukprot:10773117-Prorocentrum_lima.AAC.1